MHKRKYNIWLGNFFDNKDVKENPAISPAGNKWQKNFILSFLQNSFSDFKCVGHYPQRAFPNGKLLISSTHQNHEEVRNILAPYLNIYKLRDWVINFFLILKITFLFLTERRSEFFFSYNIYSYNSLLALYLKKVWGLKWVIILTDPISDISEKFHPYQKYADAHIYLSYGSFMESKAELKYHFDCGVEIKEIRDAGQRKVLIYTGRISKHNGIELLLDAFNLLDDSFTLLITGKGENVKLSKEVEINTRIKFYGVVHQSQLEELVSSADILINPRLIQQITNKSIFPSKISDYLAYGKSIISTKTFGISEEYNDVIDFVYSDDPKELADKIKEISNWTEVEKIERCKKINQFVKEQKNWAVMSMKLNLWIKSIGI